jgi:hypothetical protein
MLPLLLLPVLIANVRAGRSLSPNALGAEVERCARALARGRPGKRYGMAAVKRARERSLLSVLRVWAYRREIVAALRPYRGSRLDERSIERLTHDSAAWPGALASSAFKEVGLYRGSRLPPQIVDIADAVIADWLAVGASYVQRIWYAQAGFKVALARLATARMRVLFVRHYKEALAEPGLRASRAITLRWRRERDRQARGWRRFEAAHPIAAALVKARMGKTAASR